jgi:hypothetical protein
MTTTRGSGGSGLTMRIRKDTTPRNIRLHSARMRSRMIEERAAT